MEGHALAGFQWMTSNGQFISWPVFLQALQTWFGLSQYEDTTNALCKLTQRSTVTTYLSEFKDLANHIVGLPPSFLLSCFISGWTLEIRREVQAHQPLMLVQAAGLAKLQEEKLLEACSESRACAPLPPQPLSTVTSTSEAIIPGRVSIATGTGIMFHL